MIIRVGINGLGRIGRCVLRALAEIEPAGIEVVAVNGPAPTDTHLHLLRYDSIHGPFHGTLSGGDDWLDVGHGKMRLFHERDPRAIPWEEAHVDVVLECTGKFRTHEQASLHLTRGVKKVLISAPSPDADATIVYGVNTHALRHDHHIISVGSCTTNCLAPIAHVMQEAVGIQSGFMTTIHSYTGDQNLVDGSHKDPRRARAAAMSMIPTSTGAAKALGQVLPQLQGKLHGTAVRVPTPNVSLVDFTFYAERDTTAAKINQLLRDAAEGTHHEVLSVCDAPLVSIDHNRSPYSAVVDAEETYVVNGRLCRIAAWYDNEWGFSRRMLDMARLCGTHMRGAARRDNA